MAAQAIGRATVLRDANSIGVAVGATVFMLSDSILAINKFAMPVPASEFLVLATYYTAQILIVHNTAPVIAGSTRNPVSLEGAQKPLDAGSSPA
jgi:uncharacterized membrane protein YhhN